MSFFATWLDSTLAGFDGAVINFMHALAVSAGTVLTPLMRFITLIGEKGLIVLILALVLMCFSKTRRAGICVFGAVCCGALITSICLKDAVARMRPLEASETYRAFWQFVGAPFEDGFSFPSGHVTAVMAGLSALCASLGKNGKKVYNTVRRLCFADGHVPRLSYGALSQRCYRCNFSRCIVGCYSVFYYKAYL